MPKNANQKLKLPYLMKIMLEKTDEEHGLTMSEILDELAAYGVEAERKSIYTDFEDMLQLGVEVISDKRGRSCRYHVAARQFEQAELKLLIDAIQSSRFITEKKSRQLIGKIKTLASENEAKALQRQVYVHGRIKSMNESIYYNVDEINTAINDNRKITFKYYKWDTNKKLVPRRGGDSYVVSPWALTWDDENYYMVAFDEESNMIKHYRVDKMMQIDVLGESREGKTLFKDFDIAAYSRRNFGMYSGELKNVTIEFPDEMVGVFIDRFGKDIPLRKAGKDRSRTRVEVAVSEQFFGWIMGLGTGVVVTAPQSVVNDIGKAAKAFAKNYR
jgi:predicted DNA-binding transcriptional regulator YafY